MDEKQLPPASGSDADPLLVGIIGDVQYANVEDGTDFSGRERRYFRHTLKIVQTAVDSWNRQGVGVVVQMGDIIDGCNSRLGASESALRDVLGVFSRSTAPVRVDLVGNHELYNFPRHAFAGCGLNLVAADTGKAYTSMALNAHWDLLVLDAFEVAAIGYPMDHPFCVAAIQLLEANNPNIANRTGGDWFRNLPRERHRFVPYNGGVSDEQLAWLRRALEASAKAGKSVLVFTHVPLCEQASAPKTVLFNAEEVLKVLHAYSDTVVAVIAGHDHDGGYAVDAAGLHHITVNSPLTSDPAKGPQCHAVLECHAGSPGRRRAMLRCYGRACVESSTCGAGRAYPELLLERGAVNVPVD